MTRVRILSMPWSQGLAAAISPLPPPPPPPAFDYFISPTGGTGTGAQDDPWSLSYALGGAGGALVAGKTAAMLGGSYTGFYLSSLNGSAVAPITIRQFPGQRARLDGSIRDLGSYTWFWGFEIYKSAPLSGPDVAGVEMHGLNSKCIHLVIHDAMNSGVGFWNPGRGGELYGCLLYNNGTQYNNDHAVYMNVPAADQTRKTIRDCIMFNNWTYGLHGFSATTGELVNLSALGNVAFGNGSISDPVNTAADYLISGSSCDGIILNDNASYELAGSGNWAARIGDVTVTNGTLTCQRNTFVKYVPFGAWNFATVRDNAFIARNDNVLSVRGSFAGYIWSTNTHYRIGSASAWDQAGALKTFANWKTGTGLGGTDSNPAADPSGTMVLLRPSAFETGRATIIVYNWDGLGSVAVDLSSVLSLGQAYTVKNVQDFYGATVASGTYSGAAVTLSMAGITAPSPLGRTFTTPPVTGPTFQVFVVRPTADWEA